MALLGDFGPTIKRNYTYASHPKIGVLVVIHAKNDAKEEEKEKEEKEEEKEEDKESNSGYFISISMNGKELFKGENPSPKEESNVNVILGSQPGKIRSLLIENKDIEME